MSLRFDYPLFLLGLLILPFLALVALRGADRSVRGRRIAATVVRLLLVTAAVLALDQTDWVIRAACHHLKSHSSRRRPSRR